MLIQNSDRHAGHFLYAEHWADGAYLGTSGGGGGKHGKGPTSGAVWRGNMRPVLIDHAAGFRQVGQQSGTARWGMGTKAAGAVIT